MEMGTEASTAINNSCVEAGALFSGAGDNDPRLLYAQIRAAQRAIHGAQPSRPKLEDIGEALREGKRIAGVVNFVLDEQLCSAWIDTSRGNDEPGSPRIYQQDPDYAEARPLPQDEATTALRALQGMLADLQSGGSAVESSLRARLNAAHTVIFNA